MVGHPFGLILDFLFNAVARVTVQPWNPELVEQPATAEEILLSGKTLILRTHPSFHFLGC